jgi:hypothetical protein
MGEVLADAPPQRERGRGVGCHRRSIHVIDEIRLDSPHQTGGAIEDRLPGLEALAGIIANLGIKQHLRARKQKVHRRLRADIVAHGHQFTHYFPGRGLRRRRFEQRIDGNPRRDLDGQAVMGLLQPDPGHPVAEEI